MKATNEALVGNLIHAAYEDGDQGAEDHSASLAAARDALMIRLGELERRVADAEQGRTGAEVRDLQGGQDSAGRVGGADLPDLRRLAADPGTTGESADTARWLTLRGGITDPLAASVDHHIELLSQEYLARIQNGLPGDNWYHARMLGWVCGPCRTWEMHRSEGERRAALERHTGRAW